MVCLYLKQPPEEMPESCGSLEMMWEILPIIITIQEILSISFHRIHNCRHLIRVISVVTTSIPTIAIITLIIYIYSNMYIYIYIIITITIITMISNLLMIPRQSETHELSFHQDQTGAPSVPQIKDTAWP